MGWCGRGLLVVACLFAGLGAWIGWADWPGDESDSLPPETHAIVVLGGGGAERPRQAWKLYQEGRASRIFVTGDGGSIVAALRQSGVAETALRHERAATSTYENARHLAPLLAAEGIRSALLVTTWSHARRARRIFEREMPGIQFFVACEARPARLNRWESHYQRRERLAALHHLLFHRLNCF